MQVKEDCETEFKIFKTVPESMKSVHFKSVLPYFLWSLMFFMFINFDMDLKSQENKELKKSSPKKISLYYQKPASQRALKNSRVREHSNSKSIQALSSCQDRQNGYNSLYTRYQELYEKYIKTL